MLFVRRYNDLKTELDSFYRDIVDELKKEKGLRIVNELCGCLSNEREFKSVTAVKASIPRRLTGTLRELTITVAGDSDDFFVEIHIGTWLKGTISKDGSLDKEKSIVEKLARRVGYTPLLDYRSELIKRIDELVRKHSEKELTSKKIEAVHA